MEGLPLFESRSSQPEATTVSELTQKLKGAIEPTFRKVLVRGEISNFRPAASGHVYFSLKDAESMISCALFGWGKRSAAVRQAFDFKDGLEVLCTGRVSIYAPRGSYQLVVESIEPLGAGALQAAFESLKGRLAAEGLFAPESKKALPRFPKWISVVTSPTGAAIRDLLTVLERRAPHVRVTIIPARVQGEGAAEEIRRGLELANDRRLGEVIVLARGGGSLEDLWAFNDEQLARSISESVLPVVSAVGHEIDFTIADFVSDLRAPTPSAAAEVVSASWIEPLDQIRDARLRLVRWMSRALLSEQQGLEQSKRSLFYLANQVVERHLSRLRQASSGLKNPRDLIEERLQRVDEIAERLQNAMNRLFENHRHHLRQQMAQLDALSPLKVLDRGYTIIRNEVPPRKVLRSAHEVQSGQRLTITFKDGDRSVRVH